MPLIATRGAASAQGFGEFGAVAGPAVYIEDVFSTYLYTGNGSTQTITNGIDLAGKGGLVWIKSRTASISHVLMDTNRGVSRYLNSNTTGSEQLATGFGVTNFGSTGFTVVDDSSGNYGVNGSGGTYGGNYAPWTFREQPKFFDVVTYTGNGASSQAISHALGSTPGCVIVKRTDSTSFWLVWHRGFSSPGVSYGYLNSTDLFQPDSPNNNWAAAPTSTTFTPASNYNVNGATYVAYLFAHDAGGFGLTGTDNVISCGSYTGNGSTSGPTVTLGYEPQWLMIKRAAGGTGNWVMIDSMRGFVNSTTASPSDAYLVANTSAAESTWGDFTGSQNAAIPLATGFQIVTSTATLNASGSTYIYIAIRRGPMKVPTLGTEAFYAETVPQQSTVQTTSVPFPPDLVYRFSRNGTGRTVYTGEFFDRLRGMGTPADSLLNTSGTPFLYSYSTAAESTLNSYFQLKANSRNITLGADWNSTTYGNWVFQFFRRAPGFFDVVCYTGTGSATTQAHNLGVVPELMIVKNRSEAGRDWAVYPGDPTKYLWLNLTDAMATASASLWNLTAPTSSVFSVGAGAQVNNSNTFVAYLFASCPGVSKVGSYTGTGATQVINCGFTTGARFVLIKATSTTGDWYVWDSARGIVAGNDPYLTLNTTAAEVTNTDWVDTAASGFELSNAGGNLANSNGVSYMFLAVA